MSVLDNLLLGSYRCYRQREPIPWTSGWVFELFPRLRDRQSQLSATLSGGGAPDAGHWSRARHGQNPACFMLDEPSLEPGAAHRERIFRIISYQGRRCQHLLVDRTRAALQVADRAYCWKWARSRWKGRPRRRHDKGGNLPGP